MASINEKKVSSGTTGPVAGCTGCLNSGIRGRAIKIRGKEYGIGTLVFSSEYADFYSLIKRGDKRGDNRISRAYILKEFHEPRDPGNGRIGPSVLRRSDLNIVPAHRNIMIPRKTIITGTGRGEKWTHSVLPRLRLDGGDIPLNLDDIISASGNYKAGKTNRYGLLKKELRKNLLRPVARQMVAALKHIHEHGVTHNNFNGDAIRISGDSEKYHATLGDFDYATKPVESELDKILDPRYVETNQFIGKFKRENMGYLSYLAPENVDRDNEFSSKAGDMWALGVVLYELITGHLPNFLKSESDDVVVRNLQKFLKNDILMNQFHTELDIIGKTSKDINIRLCLDLIKNLICKKEDRFTAKKAQSHPFIKIKTKKKVSSRIERPKNEGKENQSNPTSLYPNSFLNSHTTGPLPTILEELTPEEILEKQKENDQSEISRRVDRLLGVLMLPPLERDERLIATIEEAVGERIPIPNKKVLLDSPLYKAFKNEFQEYFSEKIEEESWEEYRKKF